jgi:uncharacterized protein Yka (UPF0111/DUF47 family)
MFSIKKLFGKEDKFYDLLEASASEAKASISLFTGYLQARAKGQTTINLDDFIQSRRKDKKITQQISEELAKTFVTPLEREDIEALSNALYRIPKSVEKIVERLSIYNGHINLPNLIRQVELLAQAVNAVHVMVCQLRHGTHAEKIAEHQDRLQWAEGEADKLMLNYIAELYHGSCEAKDFIIQKDIYEMTEKVVDRCRDAGNVVTQIVLKYS